MSGLPTEVKEDGFYTHVDNDKRSTLRFFGGTGQTTQDFPPGDRGLCLVVVLHVKETYI